MQLCSSDVVFNFLLIAIMQHDPAWEPGLHFAASPNAPRSPVCLKTKSSFQLYKFHIEELKKKGPDSQPGHRTTIRKHHPFWHEVLIRFGC
jgi:hypothetical protein